MVNMPEQARFAQAQAPVEDEVILSVNGISKKFCRDLKRSLLYGVQDTFAELVGLRGEKNETLRSKEFWALREVSFQLRRGEALGLIGKNGSGKSTLLRIIAGLIKPDAGSIEVNGRVAPLIALGAGFNPILTGRENIYANMSILGLAKTEIDDRFDQVVEFAEIGEAIDSPVQSYSSGMAARLGFACAIYTEPDILLIDEVLAVGDIRFRAKCNRRLFELRQKGTAFILVSHLTQSMLNVCDSAIYLLKGAVITSGETDAVMNRYEEDLFAGEHVSGEQESARVISINSKKTDENLDLVITSVFFRNSDGEMIESPETGEPIYLCITCQSDKAFNNSGVTVAIDEAKGDGGNSLILSSFNDKQRLDIPSGVSELQLYMPYLGLRPGSYTTQIHLRKDKIYTLDSVDSFRFTVKSKETMGRSTFYQPRTWEIVRSK